MRIRVVTSGIAAGCICILVLWFPYYMIGPSEFTTDWLYAGQAALFPEWFSIAVFVFCGLTVFAFGWVAARWNWADNWRASLLAGCGAGLVAGCLVYDFIGAFWFGVKGQEEVLSNFHTILTEMQGIVIIYKVIINSAMSLYLNFLFVATACAVLGALGGLASAVDVGDVWGKSPRQPAGWLFHLTGYNLFFNGVLNIIVTIAVLQVLSEVMTTSFEKYDLAGQLVLPPNLILVFGYLLGLLMIFVPLGVTWGWIIRGWRKAGKGLILSAAWLLLTFGMAFYYLIHQGFLMNFLFVLPQVFWGFIGLMLISILAGIAADDRPPLDASYRVADWLGYGLANGILGGTQLFMGVLAYAVLLDLITVVNIPHLTASGVVTQMPAQQVAQLYKILSISAEASIAANLVVGLAVAALVFLVRKIFRFQSVNSTQNNSTPPTPLPLLDG